jgi:hypothetical protein
MDDDVPNQKRTQKMLAHSKVAVELAQKDMDSGDFDEVLEPDQEEGESESGRVSPFGMSEAMEGEVGGELPLLKTKQAESSQGKVDR